MPYGTSLSIMTVKMPFLNSPLISLYHKSIKGVSYTRTNISIGGGQVILYHGVLSYGVLSGASLTALYGRFNRFLGDFRSRQGYFQFIWFSGCFQFIQFDGIGIFEPKVGFYKRASEVSQSVRKLYIVCFVFYSQQIIRSSLIAALTLYKDFRIKQEVIN